MRYSLDEFTGFLEGIDLLAYRNRFSAIKTVEMDLPKNIQALDTIYNVYWEDNGNYRHPLSFDEFYEVYHGSHQNTIFDFWQSSGFGTHCDCFPKGLQARIYRTWASLITQIHAGYVAENVFGLGTVSQSTRLDHQGTDILVNYNRNEIKIQIKKDSKRPEITRMYRAREDENGIYNIWYIVPRPSDFENPCYIRGARRGEWRDSVKQFIEFNPETGTLDRLNNGFVVFTEKEFQLIKENFD